MLLNVIRLRLPGGTDHTSGTGHHGIGRRFRWWKS